MMNESELQAHLTSAWRRRHLGSARELLRAEICLGSGRRLAGVSHAVAALVKSPGYASSRLLSWVAAHLEQKLPKRLRARDDGHRG